MQVDAIYDNGSVRLPDHLRFKRQRFAVRVEIPDEEIDAGPPAEEGEPPEAGAGDIREQISAILGADQAKLTGRPDADETKAVWRQHLEEKHLGGR